jgi:hypothetical protein
MQPPKASRKGVRFAKSVSEDQLQRLVASASDAALFLLFWPLLFPLALWKMAERACAPALGIMSGLAQVGTP